MLYLNFVTVARLERNPTLKSEIQMRGFERDIPAGFLCYPVAQAADITAFKATVVPVGEVDIGRCHVRVLPRSPLVASPLSHKLRQTTCRLGTH